MEEVLRKSVGKTVVALTHGHGARDMVAIHQQLKATNTEAYAISSEQYALLSNLFGKWELEDYCFRYLHPAEYKHIAKLLHERRIDREHYIDEFVSGLRKSMKEEGVKAEVYGRPKHIYSIWRKMQKKHLAFNELFDVRAVRIVADQLQECNAALGIVHTHFRHLPNEFDDYVAHPKPNGYQSIHTVVLGPGGKPVEIQIRTKQMHQDAELGVAAHWKYKESTAGGTRPGHEDRIAWLRRMIAWHEDAISWTCHPVPHCSTLLHPQQADGLLPGGRTGCKTAAFMPIASNMFI